MNGSSPTSSYLMLVPIACAGVLPLKVVSCKPETYLQYLSLAVQERFVRLQGFVSIVYSGTKGIFELVAR